MYNGTIETPLGSYEANVNNTVNKKTYGLLFSVVVQSAPTAIYTGCTGLPRDELAHGSDRKHLTDSLPQALKAGGGGVIAQVELEGKLDE